MKLENCIIRYGDVFKWVDSPYNDNDHYGRNCDICALGYGLANDPRFENIPFVCHEECASWEGGHLELIGKVKDIILEGEQ